MSQKFLNPIVVDGQVTAEYLDLSTTTSHIVDAGEIAWNPIDGTFDIGMLNGVTLQEGQELYFYAKATEVILNGDAVMFAGVQGDHLLIAKADRVVLNANPNYFMGVATQRFEVNDFGYVTAFGKVRELDTTAYTLGATLYYDSTSPAAGLLTETMPTANQAKIEVAAVVRAHATQGVLMVRPHIMPILNEIQDVDVTLSKVMPIDADSLFLQDTADQNIWKKLSWSNVKATLKTYFDTLYQKGTGTTNYVSKFTGATTLGDSQIFDNGTNVGIGTTSPSAKLDINDSTSIQQNFSIANDRHISIYADAYQSIINSVKNVPLVFRTFDTERMRITSGGNVGIGTTNPPYKFSVYDTSDGVVGHFGGGVSNYTLISFRSNEANVYSTSLGSYNSGMLFRTAATDRMYINSSGNVGIGTTTANYRTQIETTGADVFLSKNTNSSSFNRSYFYNNNNIGVQFLNFGSAYGFGTEFGVGPNGSVIQSNTTSVFAIGTTGAFPLILGTNGSEKIRITSSGNVGIGTTSPSERLEVQNGSSGAKIKVSNSGGGSASLEISSNASSVAQLSFTNQLSLIGGNVGIGTTSPEVKLDIYGTGTIQHRLQSSSGGDIRFSVDSVGRLGTYSASDFLLLSSGSERMRITSGGNVGIGTISPSAKLNVYGDLHLGAYSNLSTVNFENRTNKATFSISTNGVTNAAGTTITYSWADGGHGPLKFNNSSSEVMRLSANGNIGIGTTAPIHKLSVNGKIGGDVYADSFVEFPSSGNTIVKANNDVILGYSQSTSIKQSGNIGVGIVNPSASAILHLKSNSQGFLPPVMNQSERDSIGAPEQGLMIFNTDTETVDVFTNGGGWRTLAFL